MTAVARRIASIPVRASVATWTAIIDLLSPATGAGRADLEAITNIAALLISEEYTRDAPIVVTPRIGSRVRIYTVHGSDAIEAIHDEAPLASYPLHEAGWALSLPCGVEDLDDMRTALNAFPHIDVRDVTDGISVDAMTTGISQTNSLVINVDEMRRS